MSERDPATDQHTPETLPTWARRALALAERRWESRFGEGSRTALRQALVRALRDAAPSTRGGPAGPTSSPKKGRAALGQTIAIQVEQAHCARYGAAALAAELAEQRDRDSASLDDVALVAYERKWQGKLRRLQEAHPQRWRVPGLSADEVRDELTLRLLEAVRARSLDLGRHLRPGKEWGLSFLSEQRRALCQAFKLDVVPTDDLSAVLDRAPGGEQSLLEHEAGAVMALAHQRGMESLSRPQRQWLAAMKMSANAGGFFESSGKPNLAAAARVLGKDRSSATRAFGELQSHFTRELDKLR